MDEAEQVSELIGAIYDAALDPSRWVGVLEATCHFVGGATMALLSHDIMQKSACFHFSWNDNPDYTKSYREKYAAINPVIVPATIQTQIGEVSTYLDFISEEEYRATQLYKEWTEPQGYLDAIQATLEKSASSYAAVAAIYRAEHGRVQQEERRRMKLLAPHFRRAVLIGKTIDMHTVEAAALADTLDGLAAGLFLVDAAGQVLHANAQGQAMLTQGNAIRLRGSRLSTEPQAEQMLLDAFAAAASGDNGIGTKGIAVPVAKSGAHRVAHVLPLTSGERRRAGSQYSAVAAVFVQDATIGGMTPFETVAEAFKLTPAEARVLFAVVNVGGVPDVAGMLGVSQTTVKTHLQSVFQKTGTNRQADLARLVAGFISPLQSPTPQ